MNKKVIKTASVSMAAILVAGTVGMATFNSSKENVNAETKEAEKTVQDAIEDNVSFTTTGSDKEETVYVISDANGNVTKTIVSDWLKNKDGSQTITDKSDLSDIENVKSDADYTEKDGNIEWNAEGQDIYYQGTSDKQLPVDVKVVYMLDGKETKPEDIVGKSGKLTIKFEYTNNTKQSVDIDGTKTDLYVPFTMISGMLLPSENFTNIQVSSGKVISDGDKNIVVGLAFPGLNEDLNLSAVSEKLDYNFPNTVEVTADVKDFSLLMTITMGSSDLLSSVEVGNVTDVNGLKTTLGELVSSTAQLQSGAAQLSSGLSQLKAKLPEFSSGVNTLVGGIAQLDAGVAQLNSKSTEFVQGLKTAVDGANEIVSKLEGENGAVEGSAKLAQGAADADAGVGQLASKVGSTDTNAVAQDAASENPSTIAGATAKLAAGASSVDSNVDNILAAFNDTDSQVGLKNGSQAVADGVNQLSTQLTTMVASLQENIATNKTSIDTMTAILKSGKNPATGQPLTAQEIATYTANIQQLTIVNATLQNVLGQMPQGMQESLQTLTSGAQGVANGVNQLQTGITQFKQEGTSVLAQGTAALNSKMPELTSGVAQIKEGTSQLATGTKTLADGVMTLYQAINTQLKPGLQALYDGGCLLQTSAGTMYDGTQQLKAGSETLKAGTTTLVSGVDTLASGADQLSTGITKYKEQGIDKISTLVNSDLSGVVKRLEATLKIAKEYSIYSQAVDGKDCSVKFIYKTDSIK